MLRDTAGLAEALRLPVAGHLNAVREIRRRIERAGRFALPVRIESELPLAVQRNGRSCGMLSGRKTRDHAGEQATEQGERFEAL